MKLKVLGSSSSGNCYLLIGQTETLMLECGVKFSEVKKALNFNIAQVAGCLVTHEHGDHAKYALDVLRAGITLYGSGGTIEMINTGKYYPVSVNSFAPYRVGGFKVLPIDAEHDASEPLSFYIHHPECGTILFATDTQYVTARMKEVNTFLIEANYSEQEMDQRIMSGDLNPVQARRTEASHMSLEGCLGTLREFDLKETKRIVLLHLSDGNSNAERFKRAVESATGKQTYVADKGLEIDININPF